MAKINKDIAEKLASLPAEKRLLLFQKLEEQSRTIQLASTPIARQKRNTEPCQLSFAQQRLWFMDQLEPGNIAYNMFNAVRLHGELNVSALEQGFQQVVQRHESLRTTFQTVDGQPHQVVAPTLQVDLPVADLSALPKTEQETTARRRAGEEAQRPFDLARGPLVRGCLLKLADDEHILLLDMHHIISDGWSMGVLFREIVLLGQAFAAGQPDPLPALPLQYPDFALWQRDWLQGEVLETQLNYWKKQLEGAPTTLELPTDYPRPALQTFRGARLPITFSQEVTEALQALSQQEGATLFMTLLAAFQILLSRYSRQADIVVGSPIANRNRSELEGLIGFFANTLVLRTDLSGNLTFREALQRARETCLGAYDHQDLPFEKLVDEVQVTRDLSRNPLFQAMFILQNTPLDNLDLGGLRIQPLEIEPNTAQFDLRMSLQETPSGLSGYLEYNTDLFEPETPVLLVDLYRQILAGWLANPEQPLSEIAVPQTLAARAEAAQARDRKQTLAIAASFTAEPLEDALAFWMQELELPSALAFAPFGQVFQELLDPASRFSRNKDGFNLLLLRFEDWLRDVHTANPSELLERNLADLESALLATPGTVPCLVLVCPASPTELALPGRAELYQALEQRLAKTLLSNSRIHVIPSAQLAGYYPVPEYYDPQTDQLGQIPYTPTMYTAISTLLARKINAWRSLPYKVIVLDCDNTLWQGVCAEDGPLGVQIDAPHRALQEFMVEQQKAGKLLCLCSKNEETDVWQVFAQRTDMPLQREQLLAWRINWQPKSENIRSLAEELQLGLDSFIFIDDNPLECAEVRANCPQVFVLELPAAEEIPQNLQHQWAFDQLHVTSEDQRRTQMYQENRARRQLQDETLTLEKFIAQLELNIDIHEPDPSEIGRTSQLTQRTNQFNTTTLRRTETEVQARTCQVVHVRDRYGDYGLVGAMFYTAQERVLRVDSFLLSCRALGRGVEERMLVWLGEEAGRQGLERVEIEYIASSKNRPVLDFLEKVGQANPQPKEQGAAHSYPLEMLQSLRGVVLATQAPTDADAPSQVANAPSWENTRRNRLGRTFQNVDQILQAVQAYKPVRQRKGLVQYEAPRTPTEQTLVDIWKQVLNLEQVGIHDNFFSLGGDSLLATQIISRLRNTFQMDLPLRALFGTATVAGLAELIEANDEEEGEV